MLLENYMGIGSRNPNMAVKRVTEVSDMVSHKAYVVEGRVVCQLLSREIVG